MKKSIKKMLKGLWSCSLLIFSGYFIIRGILSEDFIHQIGYCLYAMGFLIIDECINIKKKLNEMREDNLKTDTAVIEILKATTEVLKTGVKKSREVK